MKKESIFKFHPNDWIWLILGAALFAVLKAGQAASRVNGCVGGACLGGPVDRHNYHGLRNRARLGGLPTLPTGRVGVDLTARL